MSIWLAEISSVYSTRVGGAVFAGAGDARRRSDRLCLLSGRHDAGRGDEAARPPAADTHHRSQAQRFEEHQFRSVRLEKQKVVRCCPLPVRITKSTSVRPKENVVLLCGTVVDGKSFLACTWTLQAYRDGFSALYTRLPQVLRDLRCYRNSA